MTPLLHARPDLDAAASQHTLLVADAVEHARQGTASWLQRELAHGSKVYYKGWLPSGRRPDQHWITGRSAPPPASTTTPSAARSAS